MDVKAFQPILDFERQLARYTGAPYAVTTDRCTHAIEIALRILKPTKPIVFTAYTYVSVVMTMHKLGLQYELVDKKWHHKYQFENTNIWDCARMLERNMFQPGEIQCLSFGRSKPLELGIGGAILTDNKAIYELASRMRYDGRSLFEYERWSDQKVWNLGLHYYLAPELCEQAGELLVHEQFIDQTDKYNYPDCRELIINS